MQTAKGAMKEVYGEGGDMMVEVLGVKMKRLSRGVGQQNLDVYSHILDHANKWKTAFDKKVLASKDGVIEYKKGNLVQIRDSKLDFTLATEVKLLLQWGAPHRVVDCIQNSYRLQTIQGLPVSGVVSAQRLHGFIPRPRMELECKQIEIEMDRVGIPDEVMEELDFEEEEGDRDEGEVDDIVLGEQEIIGEMD
jgi:hypothetical protein